MSGTIYPKRAWISAADSYAGQAEALVAMVPRLWEQIRALQPQKPADISVLGIGASHAAAAAPVYRLRQDGIRASRFLASEWPLDGALSDGTVIFVSQSGRSAEVVDLAARAKGGHSLAVTNYHPSPLGEVCGQGLNLGNLSDSSVSFVSFTGTMLALGLLADYWAGRDNPARWQEWIGAGMDKVMAADDALRGLADELIACPSVDFVAPASSVSIAEEAALMFREGPRLMATGMETRQYLHGPMDAAGKAGHVVFGGAREALLVDQLAEQSDRLAYVTGLGGGAPRVPALLTLELPVPVSEGIGFAIVGSFLAQRLTLHAADLRGIDINEAVFVRLDTKTDRVGASA